MGLGKNQAFSVKQIRDMENYIEPVTYREDYLFQLRADNRVRYNNSCRALHETQVHVEEYFHFMPRQQGLSEVPNMRISFSI